MYDIKMSPKRDKNYSSKPITDGEVCIVCGKLVKDKNRKHSVRVFWGTTAVTEAEANEIIARKGSGGDLLYYPVGSDCLRKQPELKPYVEDAKRANEESHIEEFIEAKKVAIEVSLVSAGWGKPSRVKESDIISANIQEIVKGLVVQYEDLLKAMEKED